MRRSGYQGDLTLLNIFGPSGNLTNLQEAAYKVIGWVGHFVLFIMGYGFLNFRAQRSIKRLDRWIGPEGALGDFKYVERLQAPHP